MGSRATIREGGRVEVVRTPAMIRVMGGVTVTIAPGAIGVAQFREKRAGTTLRWMVEFRSKHTDDAVILWLAPQALKALPDEPTPTESNNG
jgi:hypothetical protein